MNIKERLRHLAEISGRDRMYGKTKSTVAAAKAANGTVLTSNFDQAKHLSKFGVNARSMETNLTGLIGPFFFDHHAVEQMFTKAANKIEALETELSELKKKVGIST